MELYFTIYLNFFFIYPTSKHLICHHSKTNKTSFSMWHSERDVCPPSTSHRGARAASANNIARMDSNASAFKRAVSFQFLNRKHDSVNRETRSFVKLRYKDTAKYVIWPECRLEDGWRRGLASHSPHIMKDSDPRTILHKADMEDHRSPYLPCTINQVTRSDSEDSSGAESIIVMTRL